MQHVIFTEIEGELLAKLLDAPLDKYLRETVILALHPISDAEYLSGAAGILGTLARWSYVLDGAQVLWCIEWPPGLLVVRFSSDGSIELASLRSPNPQFGGREATPEEIEAFDEDAEDPQYNLVFDAWDAQIDPVLRDGWEPLSNAERARFEAALAHAQVLARDKEQEESGA
jgi:hypothetical protein